MRKARPSGGGPSSNSSRHPTDGCFALFEQRARWAKTITNLIDERKIKMITAAQRAAVAAANLPFELSDAEIANQFNADGSSRPFVSKFPLVRARELAVAAMNAVIASQPTAQAA